VDSGLPDAAAPAEEDSRRTRRTHAEDGPQAGQIDDDRLAAIVRHAVPQPHAELRPPPPLAAARQRPPPRSLAFPSR
jgi:hypothetical protein